MSTCGPVPSGLEGKNLFDHLKLIFISHSTWNSAKRRFRSCSNIRSRFTMISTYSLGRSFSFALILISSLILGRVGSISVKYLLMFISLVDDPDFVDLVLLVEVSFGLHKLRNSKQLFTRSRQSPIIFQRKNLKWNSLKTTFGALSFSFEKNWMKMTLRLFIFNVWISYQRR